MPRFSFRFFSRRDDVVRSIDDASRLGLPVLGSISEFEPRRGQSLPTNDYPEAIEAYRRLADKVRAPDFHLRGRAIAVTAVEGGAGNSMTAENLAKLLAQNGGRVILVDADLGRAVRRRPGDGTSASGFGGLLANQLMRPNSALVHTMDVRLKLLPAGSISRSADALLKSARLPHVIDGLRELADHVIFDAGAAYKELPHLTRHMDVTLLILDAGVTRGKRAHKAVAMLRESNEGLLGFVLNRAPVVISAPAAETQSVGEVAEQRSQESERRLEVVVGELLADLEASLNLIRDIRKAGKANAAKEDSISVTAEG
jgi:MinD-like ATPase involved in chromosome partitioning or flagellar assembly